MRIGGRNSPADTAGGRTDRHDHLAGKRSLLCRDILLYEQGFQLVIMRVAVTVAVAAVFLSMMAVTCLVVRIVAVLVSMMGKTLD